MTQEENMRFSLGLPKQVFECSIFRVHERECATPDRVHTMPVYLLECANWVNIVPITASGEVVLVEQHRFGTDTISLETPGGAVDAGEKDLTMAALRELEEETGLSTNRILGLPGFSPNPAIQNNRITFFIAFDVAPVEKPREAHDPFERIKVHTIPFQEAVQMARTGRISSALASLSLLLAEPYLKNLRGDMLGSLAEIP